MVEIDHFSFDHTIEVYRLRLERNLNDREFYRSSRGVVNGKGDLLLGYNSDSGCF